MDAEGGVQNIVADPAIGGPGDQNLGLVMAARFRHGGKFSLKSFTFGHFFVQKCTKSFQLQGAWLPDSHHGLYPWTPAAWGLLLRLPFRLALYNYEYTRNALDCDQCNYSSRIVFSHIPIEFWSNRK